MAKLSDIDLREVLATIRKVHEQVVARPKGTASSRYSYCNEETAEMVLAAIDQVLATGTPLIWPAQEISLNTQYQKFRQGCQWIRERWPADHPAQTKINAVTISKIEKLGLKIAPNPNASIKLYYSSEWRRELEEFIDTAVTPLDKFERLGVPISSDDVDWATKLLHPVAHLFIYHIEPSKGMILVIRHESADRRPTETP